MPAKKLKDFLDSHNIRYVTINHSPAYTAQGIAHIAHISGRELAKTVILKSDDKLVMAVVYSAIPYKTPWCLLGFLLWCLLRFPHSRPHSNRHSTRHSTRPRRSGLEPRVPGRDGSRADRERGRAAVAVGGGMARSRRSAGRRHRSLRVAGAADR